MSKHLLSFQLQDPPHLTLDPADGSHRGGEDDEDEGDHDEGEHDDLQREGEAAGLLRVGVVLVLEQLQLVLIYQKCKNFPSLQPVLPSSGGRIRNREDSLCVATFRMTG